MILIGISGKKGTGKDLLATFLKQKYGFVQMPFAGELKEAVRRDFGFSKEQTDGKYKEQPTHFYKEYSENIGNRWTPREIMIEYGQFFRRFDSLWWVKKLFQKIDMITAIHPNANDVRIVVSDVRFRNEADYIKEKGGYLVRLERDEKLNIYKTPSLDVSETDLDTYQGFNLALGQDKNLFPSDLNEFSDTIMDHVFNYDPIPKFS